MSHNTITDGADQLTLRGLFQKYGLKAVLEQLAACCDEAADLARLYQHDEEASRWENEGGAIRREEEEIVEIELGVHTNRRAG